MYSTRYSYRVPLDPESPWPKFKRDALQTGRSPLRPVVTDRTPWSYRTELGVFSSAVFDGDGRIYIGSGDHLFYCFDRDGAVRWRFRTGEIVDSSALLDDCGRVYVASCDGLVYALNRDTGEELWRFACDSIEACHTRGVNSFVDWFEGHIGIDSDGTIVAPNDNFHTYALDRETGGKKWHFLTGDQTWSSPAYNPQTHRWFMGTNYFVLKNLFCFDGSDGRRIWKRGTLGSMVASPVLTGEDPDDLVVAAGFDGLVRAFRQRNGRQVWKFGARDHFYSSPVLTEAGEVIIPSADGTVYALDAQTGAMIWSFDTPEPIRSTPAIDGDGNVYFGNGEGRLYCISARGEFRWSYRCTDSDRSDVNSSPAIGPDGIVVGCDDGTITSIPWDYPISDAGRDDARCRISRPEASDGARLYTLSRFGKREDPTPTSIDANQPLTLALVVRESGATQTTLIDQSSVTVTATPDTPFTSAVSADRRFITIIPTQAWNTTPSSTFEIVVRGSYRSHTRRFGLKRFGGRIGGSFEERFTFLVHARIPHADRFPFIVPDSPLEPASVIEIGRLAPSMPTILPSYNQLGFDSIHYHLTCLERTATGALLWGVGAALVGGGEDRSVVDPGLAIRFAVHLDYAGGLMTLCSEEGFTLEFNGWDIPYELFRVSASQVCSDEVPDGAKNSAIVFTPGHIHARVRCDDIKFYGPFLKVLGVSEFRTGLMHVSGGVGKVRYLGERVFDRPEEVGEVNWETREKSVSVELTGSTLKASEHNIGVLLVDSQSSRPVPINYTKVTRVAQHSDGTLKSVTVDTSAGLRKPIGSMGRDRSASCRAYLLIDGLPVARDTIVR